MKKFSVIMCHNGERQWPQLDESDTGEFVKFDDADYWHRLALAAIEYIKEIGPDLMADIPVEARKAKLKYQKLLQERDKHE
mgnify:CR=1 FL=1